jgi:hypothetical protein
VQRQQATEKERGHTLKKFTSKQSEFPPHSKCTLKETTTNDMIEDMT